MLRKSKQWNRALHYLDWNEENRYLIQWKKDSSESLKREKNGKNEISKTNKESG